MGLVRLHALAACLALSAPGAEPLRLSLADAVTQALEGNPEVDLRQADKDAARGQMVQAGLRPNPRITLQTEDIRTGSPQAPFSFANSTEDYILVGQTIEIAGKRSGRVKVASENVHAAEGQQSATRRQIIARVTSAYWAAAAAKRNQELTEQSVAVYDEDIAYVENRVKEGVTAEGDLIRLKIEKARAQATAIQSARDSNQTRVLLLRSMGKNSFPELSLTTGLEEVVNVEAPAVERVLEQRPEIAIAQSVVKQAENNVSLQHSYSKPDPQVFLGYKRNTGFDTAYAALQIDLPIHNRNQGNIGTAQAQLHIARAQLELAARAVRADYESAVQAYGDTQRLVAPLRNTIADAQDAERRARAAYREGALDILRLLDATRSRIQVELDYARALTELQQAVNTVQQATGEPFRAETNK